jgi:glycine/D-amino acid oxidase-like deaminating enzyme
VDPDAPLPENTAEVERLTRGYLADRFPALAQARLTGKKTCRYELSPDSHFIVAPHPEHPSVWIVGGGSGHGFKHGPALGERIAAAWDGAEALPPRFALGERAPGSSFRTAGSNRAAGGPGEGGPGEAGGAPGGGAAAGGGAAGGVSAS